MPKPAPASTDSTIAEDTATTPADAVTASPAPESPPAATDGAAVPPSVTLVKMHRVDVIDGGPTEADVHPDEVANYQAFGWRVTE